MDKLFWDERWQHNQIGFHETQVQSLLADHWSALRLADDAQVFVPLCGKSLDMRWLHERGHRVLGVELSALACAAFFAEAGLVPQREDADRFVRYAAQRYRLLCGDVFDLIAADVCDVRGVYDRAALIALPPPMRRRYAGQLLDILPAGTQMLLIALEFDIDGFSSPPFSVSPDEVIALFGARCDIVPLASGPTTVKGRAATHTALHLQLR